MTKRILLITGDPALRREIGDALEAPEEDLSVLKCVDDSRARRELIDFRPDFVIVSLALALDSKSPVADYGGLSFCKAAVAVSRVPIGIVTPSPVPDAVIDALGTLGKNVSCHPIRDGYIAKVLQQIRTAKPPAKRLEILIEGQAENRWSYKLRGENFEYPFSRVGTLSFDLGAQALCKTLADMIGSVPPDWETQFENLGRGIVMSLFGVDSSFANEVRLGVQEAGGLHNTRVIFAVGKEQYGIALEAVFPPLTPARYPWMIHAPLVRNIRGMAAANTPLFDGPPRLKRCLIVGANTSGFCDEILVGGSSLQLGELSHIKSECEAVVALFKDAQRDAGFEDPKVVGTDPGKPLGKQDFQNLLTEPWDVIHFAGHAYHSPTTDQNGASVNAQHACLFVGKPGSPEAVEMNTIAPSLRETTSLLYLSGCKTANAGFAVAAAQYGVPAVLGFRWKVQDKPAEQHARLFYHQLFREKAIDKAFRNTRRGMRLLNRKDNAWASGMLVMTSQ
jgi:hypothetical protein